MPRRGCTCIILPPFGDRGPRVIMDPWCPQPQHRARAVVEEPNRG